MAIAKKGRRTLHIGEASYSWFVCEDDDSLSVGAMTSLTILSSDKDFQVVFPIGQQGASTFLIVRGPRFGGSGTFGGPWKRVACPDWCEGSPAITPAIVRSIVIWALGDKQNIFVNYRGEPEEAGSD